ncbi:MAG: hypothetical protein AAFR58_23020, partial [Cyanobacteria bacterium J06627_28]
SGAHFIEPITPLVDLSLKNQQDILVFELQAQEKVWTKRDAFVLMDCDEPKYSESKQRLASFSLWKKTNYTLDFIDEYLHYAQDERLITDLENQCAQSNYPEFKDHRHDQSIFSLLTKKHNLEAYRDPSQWGNDMKDQYTNSSYPQLIEHTRKRGKPPLSKRIRNRVGILTQGIGKQSANQ